MRMNDTPDQYRDDDRAALLKITAMSPAMKLTTEHTKKNVAAGGGPELLLFSEALSGGGGPELLLFSEALSGGGGPELLLFSEALSGGGGGLSGSTMFFFSGSGRSEPHFGQFVPPMCVSRSNGGAKMVLQIGH